jgi:hypothetical protein
MPPLLLKLWREQHPEGHEQVQLDFTSRKPIPQIALQARFGEGGQPACKAWKAT